MDRTEFRKILAERVVILDGAMGTELQKRGCFEGVEAPEELNVLAPGRIQEVQKEYLEAGSEMVLANTFGANRLKLAEYHLENRLEELNRAGIGISRAVAEPFGAWVAGDIGPLGSYLEPLGPLTFDRACETFAEQVRALAAASPDLLVIETMAEIREVKAALLAARDNYDGPVIVQMTFTADGTTVTGTSVEVFAAVVERMGADAIGMNCSVGPQALAALAKRLTAATSLPVSFKPNAGMPKLVNRETVFPGTPEEFTAAAGEAYRCGVNLLGGCCGTNPGFIRALAGKLKNRKPVARQAAAGRFVLASRTKAFELPESGRFSGIGERINPTNRKKFQEELLAGNFATIRREAQSQVKSGAAILDLNLGLPGADEPALMKRAVEEIQEVVSAPLCLDSSSLAALEAGLKACAGKPIVNSVNGDHDKLEAILPLVRRFGAAVVGLTVDERGIPQSAAERLAIAERILAAAERHGIPRPEVILDYLTLAASAMAPQIRETLEAIRESKRRWPEVRTVLGVSNVSFGLPDRQALNSTFLKLAREAGLDLGILNPHEGWETDDPLARDLLLGKDPGGEKYVKAHAGEIKKRPALPHEVVQNSSAPAHVKLYSAVVEGDRELTPRLTQEALQEGLSPIEIANTSILKALNEVGEKFNNKEYFLPQVIRSAEAAQAAFGIIKPLLKKEGGFSSGKIVLATVKGDVHDIGKNIVAAVLESHGWEVVDLGKNVEAAQIVEAARKEGAGLIGLSALMTTTMLEMEKVVRARDAAGLKARVIVGGAPVTERFAREIGADGYARDAVQAAAVARSLSEAPERT